jgi:hypothetical protein
MWAMATRIGMTCAAAAAALAVAGCNSSGGGGTTSSAPAKKGNGPTAPEATVKLVAPKDGGTVGSKFTAKVELKNFTSDKADVGKSPILGKGHLHFQLDGGKFDFPKYSGANGKLAKKLGVDGKYSPSLAPTITYTGIPPGTHKLEVYLANNNHTDTGVETETDFTVK